MADGIIRVNYKFLRILFNWSRTTQCCHLTMRENETWRRMKNIEFWGRHFFHCCKILIKCSLCQLYVFNSPHQISPNSPLLSFNNRRELFLVLFFLSACDKFTILTHTMCYSPTENIGDVHRMMHDCIRFFFRSPYRLWEVAYEIY